MINIVKNHIKANFMYYIVWAALMALSILLFFKCCTADIINYDSSYQYFLTLHDFEGIFRLLPEDYSPPLYTVIVKLWTLIFGPSLKVMRSAALIAVGGMLFTALFPVRAAFGKKAAVISAIMFSFSSINFLLIPEIRPTVFAYFFVTAAAAYFYLSYFYEYKYAYICTAVFSVLSMYTHNIGMLSVLSFYIIAIAFSFFEKRYDKMRNYFISGAVSAVIYIPWLTVVIKQFGNVQNNYWKNSLTSISYIYDWSIWINFKDFDKDIIKFPITLIIIAALLHIILKSSILKQAKEEKNLSLIDIIKTNENRNTALKILFCILLLAGPIIIYLAFCEFVYPVITERYFYIFTGIAMLIIASIISRCSNKIITGLFIGAVSVNLILTVNNTVTSLDESNFGEMISFIESDSDDSPAFLHSHEWSLGIMMYYFPDAKHYIYDDTWCVLNTYDVFAGEVIDIGAPENISSYEDSFYIIGNDFPDTKESISALLSECGRFNMKNCGFYNEPYTYVKNWVLVKVDENSQK